MAHLLGTEHVLGIFHCHNYIAMMVYIAMALHSYGNGIYQERAPYLVVTVCIVMVYVARPYMVMAMKRTKDMLGA